MQLAFSRENLLRLSEKLFRDARSAAKEGDMGKAAELYFHAAEGHNHLGDRLFAARLHCLSFLSKIQDDRYLKDRPNQHYLGPYEEILSQEKRFDMLIEGYKKINEQLAKSRHFVDARIFYIKEMKARKKFFAQQRRFSLWGLYRIWELSSLFGESAFRLLLCILILSLIQALMLLPAPVQSMQTIYIATRDFQLESFFDYWYLSFAILFSWDWKILRPINALGFLTIFFRFLLSLSIVTLFVNVLIRKMSPK